MMERSADAWEHNQFKEVVVKVANIEIYYKVRLLPAIEMDLTDKSATVGAQLLSASPAAIAERSLGCPRAENRSHSSCQDVPEIRRITEFVSSSFCMHFH